MNTVTGQTDVLLCKKPVNFHSIFHQIELTFLVKCVVRLSNINQPLKNLNKTCSDRSCSYVIVNNDYAIISGHTSANPIAHIFAYLLGDFKANVRTKSEHVLHLLDCCGDKRDV